jgi:hypothetical protein
MSSHSGRTAPQPAYSKPDADRDLVEFTYVYDRNESPPAVKSNGESRAEPRTAREAVAELFRKNRAYARFMAECRRPPNGRGWGPVPGTGETASIRIRLAPGEVGLDRNPKTGFPKQKPFAAFLGCVDARAPVEVVFAQGFDDLYIFRIAGNSLGPDCAASLHYALHKLAALHGTPPEQLEDRTLRLVVALGHGDCGAVTAAVDTLLGRVDLSQNANGFLVEDSVRGLLARIHQPALVLAARALPVGSFGSGRNHEELHRRALIELTVHLNAAWSGHAMNEIVRQYRWASNDKAVGVRYGVFDPRDCYVRAGWEGYHITDDGESTNVPRKPEDALKRPPADLEELNALAERLAEELRRCHGNAGKKKALQRYFRL